MNLFSYTMNSLKYYLQSGKNNFEVIVHKSSLWKSKNWVLSYVTTTISQWRKSPVELWEIKSNDHGEKWTWAY